MCQHFLSLTTPGWLTWISHDQLVPCLVSQYSIKPTKHSGHVYYKLNVSFKIFTDSLNAHFSLANFSTGMDFIQSGWSLIPVR